MQEMKWASLYAIKDNDTLNRVPTLQKAEAGTTMIDDMMYEMYHSREDDKWSYVWPC